MCLTFKRMKNTNKKQPHCKSGRHDSFMFFLFFWLCVDFVVVACVCSPQFQVTTYIRAKKEPLTHTLVQAQREPKTCTAFLTIPFIRRNTFWCVRVSVRFAWVWVWASSKLNGCVTKCIMTAAAAAASLYACNVSVDIAWTRAILTLFHVHTLTQHCAHNLIDAYAIFKISRFVSSSFDFYVRIERLGKYIWMHLCSYSFLNASKLFEQCAARFKTLTHTFPFSHHFIVCIWRQNEK